MTWHCSIWDQSSSPHPFTSYTNESRVLNVNYIYCMIMIIMVTSVTLTISFLNIDAWDSAQCEFFQADGNSLKAYWDSQNVTTISACQANELSPSDAYIPRGWIHHRKFRGETQKPSEKRMSSTKFSIATPNGSKSRVAINRVSRGFKRWQKYLTTFR